MSAFDITIAGEINLDLILYGLPLEMEVERELLATDFRYTLGSSSAILAHNLATLGTRVGFISKVGADALGSIALDRLREAGVDVSRTLHGDGLTGVTVLLPHGETRHILTYPGVMASMHADELDVEYLASGRHFHISSLYLQKALQPGLPALCRQLKERGLSLSLDTNDDPNDRWGAPLDELLSLVDVFLPNEDEALRITRTGTAEAAAAALAQRVQVVAIKCGPRGALVQTGTAGQWVSSLRVDVVDTIGAGDSFNTGFLKAFLDGHAPPECAAAGVAAAALSVQCFGGTEAFRDRLRREEFLRQHWPRRWPSAPSTP